MCFRCRSAKRAGAVAKAILPMIGVKINQLGALSCSVQRILVQTLAHLRVLVVRDADRLGCAEFLP